MVSAVIVGNESPDTFNTDLVRRGIHGSICDGSSVPWRLLLVHVLGRASVSSSQFNGRSAWLDARVRRFIPCRTDRLGNRSS
jgi:hypothetical protein